MICIVNQYFIIYMVSLLVLWNNKYFFAEILKRRKSQNRSGWGSLYY